MILSIRTYGDPVLRRQSRPIPEITPAIRELVDNMFETMYAAEGIGLAAPQVGESLRLFVIDLGVMDEEPTHRPQVFVNPTILEYGPEKDSYEEGCLSLPTIREDVIRPTSIKLSYETLEGEKIEEEISGFPARVIQHEYDHLQGVLFIDRIGSLKRSLLKKTLKKIAEGRIQVEYSENYRL